MLTFQEVVVEVPDGWVAQVFLEGNRKAAITKNKNKNKNNLAADHDRNKNATRLDHDSTRVEVFLKRKTKQKHGRLDDDNENVDTVGS